ncbi:MAG: hypothetical protein AABX03_04615 [Nanoarchaeota archaeon]
MAILQEHLRFFREIFSIKDFFGERIASIGVQEIRARRGGKMPKDFDYKNFKELLFARGVKAVDEFDYFDEKANIKFDFNRPIDKKYYEKYNTVIDIGSLEHIFDTKQAMENCLRMVKVNGFYFLHTPVNGYFKDGFHTFNPDAIIGALKSNGFQIIYEKYGTLRGKEIKNPAYGRDVNLWIVARKLKKIDKFNIPQQEWWDEMLKEDWKSNWKQRVKRREKNYLQKLIERLKIIWYAAGLQ